MSSDLSPLFSLRSPIPVTSLSFLTNGDLATGDAEGHLSIWDITTNRITQTLKPFTRSCIWIQEFKSKVIVQGLQSGFKIYGNVESGVLEFEFSIDCNHNGFCKSCLLSDECVLIYPDQRDTVKVYSLELQAATVTSLTLRDQGMIMALCSVKNDDIFVLSESGTITVWNYVTGIIESETSITKEVTVCLNYDHETNQGICGTVSEQVIIFNLTPTDKKINVLKTLTMTNPGTSDVCIRSDHKLCVCAGWDGRLRVFSMKSFKLLAVLVGHKGTINCASYAPSPVRMWKAQFLLCSGGNDKQIYFWKIYE